jgi:hypothetical protein
VQKQEEEKEMRPSYSAPIAALFLMLSATAHAALIVDYTHDAGGTNSDPLNGLAARATFSLSGNVLSILVENTSTGVPATFADADSLLVSLGFNLPSALSILSGDTATIGAGSTGLGSWAARSAGDSVAEQWLWTNDYGGDLMNSGQPLATRQVISTSDGQDGGVSTLFGGGPPNVDGPYGGIAASPVLLSVPQSKPAVSNSILFTLTLDGTLSDAELAHVADGAVVEFGSDARYLDAPEPAALLLVLLPLTFRRR